MTTSPLTSIPAPRTDVDDAARTSRDDAVMLPRHIADAAYHVLQAIHALKDNGSHELFNALGKALDKGSYRPIPHVPPPCEVCHIDVAYGLPHHPDCWSDEAVAHRNVAFPQLEPEA